MGEETPSSANGHNSDNFGGSNNSGNKQKRMPPEDREDKVLEFFVKHGFPLPPKALYRAMKVSEEITFSYRTVQNILGRLLEKGDVVRLDKEALDNGVLKPLGDDEEDRRTYYFITDQGRRRLEGRN